MIEGYARGKSNYEWGYWLTIGGLAAMVVPQWIDPGLSDPTALAVTAGFVGYEVGIPMMGINAGRMRKAVSSVEPGYAPPNSGWLCYGIGKGLQGAAMGMIAIQGMLDAFSFFTQDTPSQEIQDAAVYPMVAGLGFEWFSWYQFSRVRGSAEAHAPTELKLSLRVQKGSGNRPIPGAYLALNF